MILRGIDFGPVLGASGVQGFFEEGYWFHKVLRLLGLDFSGMTFVAKTTTLLSRKGNMELTRYYTPRNLFPSCVKARFLEGLMLNSVGLSGPGLGALLGTGKWQKRKMPFFISLMSLADTPQRRREELRIMIEMIKLYTQDFSARFGLQINLSCPNTGHKPSELIRESADVCEIASSLGVPIMTKYSIASAPIEAVMELNDNFNCDAICVSNTLPFGWGGVDWRRVWGSEKSPLAKMGGGGLSGRILRPLVCAWIKSLRDAGFTKPINGGGGIFYPIDVDCYHHAGASSIFLGSGAVLRPWKVREVINRANSLEWK